MTITLTTAQSQSFLNTVTFISYVSTMNGHRDIWIRRPLTLQSHVIKMTTSQNHVNTKTKHRRVIWLPPPPKSKTYATSSQSYMNTMTNIAELCNTTAMSQVTWKQWTTVHHYVTATTAIIELCGCHHHHSRVICRPLSLRYVETTIHFIEL